MSVRNVKEGKRFGNLKVEKDLGCDKSRHHYYLCLCLECNTLVKMSKEKLQSVRTIKCTDCERDKKYIGKIINGYEVERRITAMDRKDKTVAWECRCQKCGHYVDVSDKNIKNGSISVCKCMTKQLQASILL